MRTAWRRCDDRTSTDRTLVLWRYQKALVHRARFGFPGRGLDADGPRPWNERRHHWKCDFVSISGSFKDRGVSVMINNLSGQWCRESRRGFLRQRRRGGCDLRGGRRIECRIHVPAQTSPGKITQIADRSGGCPHRRDRARRSLMPRWRTTRAIFTQATIGTRPFSTGSRRSATRSGSSPGSRSPTPLLRRPAVAAI